ncbi:MAG: hypothetical protein M1818_004654 [Claussenomyces sp. TS43310]|nr:MAG: hypothetical protein M1818_004654 [Claussenomyces sp. TS43310]
MGGLGGARQAGVWSEKAQETRLKAIQTIKKTYDLEEFVDLFPMQVKPAGDLGNSAINNLRTLAKQVPALTAAKQLMVAECVDDAGEACPITFKHTASILGKLKLLEINKSDGVATKLTSDGDGLSDTKGTKSAVKASGGKSNLDPKVSSTKKPPVIRQKKVNGRVEALLPDSTGRTPTKAKRPAHKPVEKKNLNIIPKQEILKEDINGPRQVSFSEPLETNESSASSSSEETSPPEPSRGAKKPQAMCEESPTCPPKKRGCPEAENKTMKKSQSKEQVVPLDLTRNMRDRLATMDKTFNETSLEDHLAKPFILGPVHVKPSLGGIRGMGNYTSPKTDNEDANINIEEPNSATLPTTNIEDVNVEDQDSPSSWTSGETCQETIMEDTPSFQRAIPSVVIAAVKPDDISFPSAVTTAGSRKRNFASLTKDILQAEVDQGLKDTWNWSFDAANGPSPALQSALPSEKSYPTNSMSEKLRRTSGDEDTILVRHHREDKTPTKEPRSVAHSPAITLASHENQDQRMAARQRYIRGYLKGLGVSLRKFQGSLEVSGDVSAGPIATAINQGLEPVVSAVHALSQSLDCIYEENCS